MKISGRNQKVRRRNGWLAWISVFLLVTSVLGAHAKMDPVDKLDCRLKALLGKTDSTLAEPLAISAGAAGKVFVEVRLHTTDPSVFGELKKAGLNIKSSFQGLVSGTIASSKLLDLANLKVVSTVHPYIRPITRAIQGEGVKSLRADLLREATPGFDGTGVKIGVMSDSFACVSDASPLIEDIDGDGIDEIMGTDSQLAGDLPPVIELLEEIADDWGDDEGRAMAEIVHEMAPGSELAFHTAFNGQANWAEGIVQLAEAGCKVLVDDVIYLTMPAYQYGEVAQAIQKVAEEYDVVYLTAAGNQFDQCIETGYRDIDPENDDGPWSKIPKGNDFHNWGARIQDKYLNIYLPPEARLRISLFWENPYSGTLGPGASTDYDLYVLDEYDNFIAVSDTTQGSEYSPMGDPFEFLGVSNPSDTDFLHLKVVVNKHHGPPVNFKLFFWGPTIRVQSDARMGDDPFMIGHNLSDYLLNVAAVHYYEHDSGGTMLHNPRRIDPAYYESLGGPVRILFSPQGEPYETPQIRLTPDITSIDGVNTSFFYSDHDYDDDDIPNFFGTSAAAPHAAAIAALMRQANPSLTAAEIRDLMRQAATDIYKPGVDEYTGYGFLYADDAVNAVPGAISPEKPTPIPTRTPTPTPTVTPTFAPVFTPEPVIIAVNQVIVTDSLFTYADLSNGKDYDETNAPSLVVRWNLNFPAVIDYHLYVQIDGQPKQYLGRTGNADVRRFEWKANQPLLNPIFRQGPEFGKKYVFHIYAINGDAFPRHFGPFSTSGPVEIAPIH